MRRECAAGRGGLERLATRAGEVKDANEDEETCKSGETNVADEGENETKEDEDGTWQVACCLPDRVREALGKSSKGVATGFRNDSKSLS